jgi:transcriptional antiterminator NusG
MDSEQANTGQDSAKTDEERLSIEPPRLTTPVVEQETSEPVLGEEPLLGEVSGEPSCESSDESVASEDDKEEGEKGLKKKKRGKVVQTLKELDPERAALPWYAVHTYSGFEMRVKLSLEERIRLYKMERKFGNILVPEETVVELVRGQKKTSQRKFLPGYILVQMHFDEDTWHLVRETPKVTGFVGNSTSPSPLAPQEVQGLITQMQGGAVKPKPKVNFEQGDAIKVIDGPFAEFNGIVDEVKTDKGKLRVLISIFGRNTPVELDFVQVEKI